MRLFGLRDLGALRGSILAVRGDRRDGGWARTGRHGGTGGRFSTASPQAVAAGARLGVVASGGSGCG
jgi:hypothetical protein